MNGRISESSLDDLRHVDPSEAVRALGLDRGSIRQSTGFHVLCPAHGDKSPSCSVTRAPDGMLRVRCFACDLAGDVFNLVAAVERLEVRTDFAAVARRAAELFGIGLEEGAPRRAPTPRREPPAPPPREPLDELGLSGVLVPLDAPEAAPVAAYLEARGLLEAAIADGWWALDARELAHAIEERIALGGDPSGTAIGRAGLVRGAQIDRPTHPLAIPWRLPDGSLDTIQRRRIDAASAPPKYVFAPGRGAQHPYGIERARDEGSIAIVEGAVDVLARRLVEADGATVLGVPGVDWAARYDWSHIVAGRAVRIAFDADAAGERAAEKLAEKLYEAGAELVQRERVRGAKDWGELAAERAA